MFGESVCQCTMGTGCARENNGHSYIMIIIKKKPNGLCCLLSPICGTVALDTCDYMSIKSAALCAFFCTAALLHCGLAIICYHIKVQQEDTVPRHSYSPISSRFQFTMAEVVHSTRR